MVAEKLALIEADLAEVERELEAQWPQLAAYNKRLEEVEQNSPRAET